MFDFKFPNRCMIVQNLEKGFVENGAASRLHRQTKRFYWVACGNPVLKWASFFFFSPVRNCNSCAILPV